MELLSPTQASDLISQLALLPTGLSAAELAARADLPPQLRALCLASAKITQINVLEAIRQEAANLATGTTGAGFDLAAARTRLKGLLGGMGFPVNDPTAGAGAITEIASSSRLNLILKTVVGQAQAAAKREVSMHPAILSRWPNFMYISQMLDTSRPTHTALNGVVRPKTDPWWATHTGPWDYNCVCDVEDAGPEAQVSSPDGLPTETNQSGYTWDASAPLGAVDWSSIPDGPLKELAKTELEKAAA